MIEFFRKYEPKGKLIDLGFGQGRYCFPIARLGYKVTGIDKSTVGIEQMIEKSNQEGLNITGLVGDIYKLLNRCSKQNHENELIKWKLLLAFSEFPESEADLIIEKTNLQNERLKLEIDRSISLIKKLFKISF